jgi:hypothetical protein
LIAGSRKLKALSQLSRFGGDCEKAAKAQSIEAAVADAIAASLAQSFIIVLQPYLRLSTHDKHLVAAG